MIRPMASDAVSPLWARTVADQAFREALIDDPLRALAEAGNVTASAEQVRQLEEMGREERQAFVVGVVREVHFRGATARFGSIGRDGRLGGGRPPD